MKKELGMAIGKGYTAEVFDWEEGWIIKLFRDFVPGDWVDYEAKVSRAAFETGVCAPRVGDVVEVNGRRGILYEKKEGQSMLKEIISNPKSFKKNSTLLADLHFQIHMTQANRDLPRQRDIIKYKIGKTNLDPSVKKNLLDYLDTLPDDDKLCHNDFHPDNILMTSDGPFIIDWMDGSSGNPLADSARTSLMLRIGTPPNEGFFKKMIVNQLRKRLHQIYMQNYLKLSSRKFSEIKAWEPVIAAVRLLENHPGEEGKLMKMILSLN